ncbi:MAG: thiamine diphosphokinase [Ilumatobacteraceae bacterium]|nr:thiamine diphosphokinase [Ilumatobacteraceae bacterium]
MAPLSQTKKFAVIILGGAEPRPDIAKLLPVDAVIVAADSGWGNARVLGLTPDVLIGDMDSILPADLLAARQSDATVFEFDADKDATDTELALTHAQSIGCTDIVVVSGGGDRIDHVLGIIAALGHASLTTCTVTAFIDTARFTVVRAGSPVHIDAPLNSSLSIFAMGSMATGVTVRGTKWLLDNATLSPHESRGVSNSVTASPVEVFVTHGTLIVIQPQALANP